MEDTLVKSELVPAQTPRPGEPCLRRKFILALVCLVVAVCGLSEFADEALGDGHHGHGCGGDDHHDDHDDEPQLWGMDLDDALSGILGAIALVLAAGILLTLRADIPTIVAEHREFYGLCGGGRQEPQVQQATTTP